MSLNKCMFIGNLGRDPEVRTFQNGSKVVNLRVACSETWKDKNTGERRERTEWVSVAIFAEHPARYAEQYLRKGSKVYIEGKLETRKWQDQSGQDRYSTEVVVRPYGGEVQGLERPQGAPQNTGYDNSPSGPQNGAGGYGGAGAPRDLDDEISF